MTDRELLELAAKAAGIQNYTMSGDALFVETGVVRGDSGYYWKPLVDDGHALRLAVMLRLAIEWWKYGVSTEASQNNRWNGIILPFGDDPFDATRRAIVRAAAEIGKEMK